MNMVQALVLGVVQGMTEFLPISSSGHLILVPTIFGWESDGLAFDTAVHLGTFFAVATVFWQDAWRMIKGAVGKGSRHDGRMGWMIVAATVPIVVVGGLFGDVIETVLRAPVVAAWSLIVWGVVLGAADVLTRIKKPMVHADERVGWKRAIAIGCAQVLSLIPGTSRSGVTMTMGLLSGLDRRMAARFSFLLSLPSVGAAAIYVLIRSLQNGVDLLTPQILVGFLAAMISGIVAIRFLLRVIERWSFLPFAIYRIALGVYLLLVVLRPVCSACGGP